MRNVKRPLYQQRHYENMVEVIRALPEGMRETVMWALAGNFKADNPKFSTVIFTKACQAEEFFPTRKAL